MAAIRRAATGSLAWTQRKLHHSPVDLAPAMPTPRVPNSQQIRPPSRRQEQTHPTRSRVVASGSGVVSRPTKKFLTGALAVVVVSNRECLTLLLSKEAI